MADLRLARRIATLAAALLLALPLHGLWRLARRPSPWPRRFLAACAWIVGARVRIVGVPLRHDVLILANHVSWVDILLLAGSADAVFVAKGELGRAPLLGWLARMNGTVFVERGHRMAVEEQVARVRAAIGRRPVAIFPEGTTEGGGAVLLPFKPALLAAMDPPPPGAVVQPALIDYGAAIADLAWTGAEPGIGNARRVLGRRGSFVATLAFAEPFAPTGGRKAIAAEARARLEALAPSP